MEDTAEINKETSTPFQCHQGSLQMQLGAAQKTLHSLCGGKGYQDGLRCVSHCEAAPHVKMET